MDRLRRSIDEHPFATVIAVVAIVTLLRAIALVLTPLNLGPDEGQYWSWSLRPDFGYYSKPPMIAWIIGASTYACGVAEVCIRITAPFLHAASTLFVYLAAKGFYDRKTAFWSALTYLLIPGTSFSSLLITTDVPLICFWSLGLWALAELRKQPSVFWASLLGAAIGLGLLSKYAMLYFLLGLGLACLPTPEGRRFLLARHMLATLAVALLVFSPNIMWNLAHGFETVRHTASNANWGSGKLFNIGHAFEFLGAQAGIIGPVAAGILVWGLLRAWREREWSHPDTLMLTMSLPIIAIVATQAFISRANANWAAPAFVTLCIIVCAWAVRHNARRLLVANTAINAAIALLLGSLAVSPALVSAIGQENSVKRLRGWDEAGRTIITIASSAPFTAILSDDREDMGSLYYYTRTRKVPLRMWPSAHPGNEYEATYALSADVSSLVLYVTRRDDVSDITNAFASVERIGSIETRLDSKRKRVFHLFALKGPMTASTFPNFFDRPSTD
jgi:4-amino-4-deoxy-L-arabinose transferase-like glycosyltransferase